MFSWANFYMEFADHLLSFQSNRKALIARLQNVYRNIGMKFPKLERDSSILDIDPFTDI